MQQVGGRKIGIFFSEAGRMNAYCQQPGHESRGTFADSVMFRARVSSFNGRPVRNAFAQ